MLAALVYIVAAIVLIVWAYRRHARRIRQGAITRQELRVLEFERKLHQMMREHERERNNGNHK